MIRRQRRAATGSGPGSVTIRWPRAAPSRSLASRPGARRPGWGPWVGSTMVLLVAAGCGGRSGTTAFDAGTDGPHAVPTGDGTGRTPSPVRDDAGTPGDPAAVGTPARPGADKMLAGALAVLDRLDDFDEARGVELVFDRLNQWSLAGGVANDVDWRADPLVDTLQADLRDLADPAALSATAFTVDGDVRHLRDQRWLADIARMARVGAVDDLDVAVSLFRWTVRSLAIVGDPPMVPTGANPGSRWLLPGEILLTGRASAPQRAWIFLELLRHAGLDGVMLATGDAEAGTLRPWIPALVSGGEAYLFEPGYGMPIPGPEGEGVATLRQAASSPAILAAMSLPDRAYPVQADAVGDLTVLVAADPWSLSRRMRLLDPLVRSAREMRVAVEASAVGSRVASAIGSSRSARLWEFPWRTLKARHGSDGGVPAATRSEFAVLQLPFVPSQTDDARGQRTPVRPLLTARLREFRGDLDGPEGAKAAYLAARPSRPALAAALQIAPPDQAERLRGLYGQMKEDATYWLGVLTLGEGEYETAVDYLARMILVNAADSRWADAARANLADAYVGLGRTADAVATLRDDLSPQRFGSRLRADRLEAAARKADEGDE